MVITFQSPVRVKNDPPAGHSASVLDIRPKLIADAIEGAPSPREQAMSVLGRDAENLVRKAICLAREHGLHREVYLLFLSALRTVRGNLKGAAP